MDSIVARRPACSAVASAGFALAVALAAILFPASIARADFPNKGDLDTALAEMTAAETQARDNVPGNSRVKNAEDARDAAKRAEEAATDALEAARRANENQPNKTTVDAAAKAKTAAAEAENTADRLRESLEDRTSDIQKERASKYREALDNRRAARKKLKTFLAELQQWLRNRRAGVGGTKEIENAINELRRRITQSEGLVTPQLAGLKSFLPMTANVSTDSPALCTFGKATPTSVALEPSDSDGNPLKAKLNAALNRALAALLAPPPGGSAAPINISNPDTDNGAKQNKPEKTGAGPTTAAEGSQAPGAGAADPKTAGKPDATPPSPVSPSILPADTPAPSTGPKRPADSGLGLMGVRLQNGEAPEAAIDRFSKLAEEARAKGDRSSFDHYRLAALAVAWWVHNRIEETLPPSYDDPPDPGMMPSVFDPMTLDEIAKKAQIEAAIRLLYQWSGYSHRLSIWRFEPQPESPGKAAGQSTATPAPASSPVAKPDPAATPQRTAAPGEKSAPAPEKSFGNEKNEKADIPDKTPGASANPGNISTGDVTIIFKVTETVLQGGPQGEETKTVMAKLTVPEPALPKTGQTKTAKAKLDTGHDRSPVTCNTGADGRCKAQIPADERESYGLPAQPPAAGLQDKTAAGADNDPLLEFAKADSAIQASQNYSVELPPAKNTGMVIQKGQAKPTSALLAALADVPPGVQVQKSDFKIGDKTYTRVGFTGPDALTAVAAKKFADRIGNDAQVDQCGEKKPGPPLGMTPVSFSALNSELPQATVDLRQSIRSGGAR